MKIRVANLNLSLSISFIEVSFSTLSVACFHPSISFHISLFSFYCFPVLPSFFSKCYWSARLILQCTQQTVIAARSANYLLLSTPSNKLPAPVSNVYWLGGLPQKNFMSFYDKEFATIGQYCLGNISEEDTPNGVFGQKLYIEHIWNCLNKL